MTKVLHGRADGGGGAFGEEVAVLAGHRQQAEGLVRALAAGQQEIIQRIDQDEEVQRGNEETARAGAQAGHEEPPHRAGQIAQLGRDRGLVLDDGLAEGHPVGQAVKPVIADLGDLFLHPGRNALGDIDRLFGDHAEQDRGWNDEGKQGAGHQQDRRQLGPLAHMRCQPAMRARQEERDHPGQEERGQIVPDHPGEDRRDAQGEHGDENPFQLDLVQRCHRPDILRFRPLP